jgi:excinuclease ABC subunit C
MPEPDAAKSILAPLPDEPGVYLMKDDSGAIVYIGKASSLKKRVSSYFRNRDLDVKTRVLVSVVKNVEYIVTDSEIEALILESSLIKRHRPKFNIQKKDDKRYPYIAVTMDEEYPRVIFTRKLKSGGARYFGPYTDAKAARNTVSLINSIFKLRICTRDLPLKAHERPCMNFQINRCSGVCTGIISRDEYLDRVDNAVKFLEGGIDPVIKNLQEVMKRYAGGLKYERASEIRDMISDIRKISESQKVLLPVGRDQDYIGVSKYGNEGILILFEFRSGVLLGRKISVFDNAEYADAGEIISAFVPGYYESADIPPRIIAEERLPDRLLMQKYLAEKAKRRVTFARPETEDDRGIMGLIKKNIDVIAAERYAQRQSRDTMRGLEELQSLLGMDVVPRTMECFDISNLQGTDAVASMVTFKHGHPDKSGYRRYKIRGYDSADDPGMIHEVVSRRIQHLFNEDLDLPDLIVIDGGAVQLTRAVEAAHNFTSEVRIISIAKRFEEIYYDAGEAPLRLPESSPGLHIIQSIRDEAHRFAITYHRTLRSKKTTRSLLDQIQVGAGTKTRLLNHFKSVDNIKNASLEELKEVRGIGDKIAEKIYRSLH